MPDHLPPRVRSTPRATAPYPTTPVRQFSFTNFSTNNPTTPQPGNNIDSEYDRSNASISQIINWLGVSLNTDGTLRTASVGAQQIAPGVFDFIATDAINQVQPLVDQATASAGQALVSANDAGASASQAASSATLSASSASAASVAETAADTHRADAQTYATTAVNAANDAENAQNDAQGFASQGSDYTILAGAWAEHMPDTIPPNILAVMGISGSHWSARWWANYAEQLVNDGMFAGPPGPTGPAGAAGATGATGPAGPQGSPGSSGVIIGSFTFKTPEQLPANGFLPANWDSTGNPNKDFQLIAGQALVYSPSSTADSRWGHLFTYVSTLEDPTGWVDVGAVRGPQGAPGAAGVNGSQGAQGVPGARGPQGDPGPQGQTGDQGSPGVQGPKGDTGAPGPPGQDAPVSTFVLKAGDTMTGPLLLSADATLPLQATTLRQMQLYASLASPVFTGNPTAPTAAPGDSDTSIATTAFTAAAVLAETNRATSAEALRAPLASPVFTGDPQAPTASPGDNDTSIATTAFVQAVVQAAVAPAQHNIGRNLLHNPLFNVAQRGAGPFTATGLTLDRWSAAANVSAFSVTRALFGLGNIVADEAAKYALSNVFTGTAGAIDCVFVYQSIEDVTRLSNKTVTVSFWAAAASGTPKLGVSLDQNFGTGGSPSAQVQGAGQAVTLSTTYTRYSLTFTLPSVAGKTLGTAGNDYTTLDIWYSSGANNAARAGNIGVQSGTISLWGVQLEIGSVATPLEKPDPRYDLSNCQRFYEVCAAYWVGTLVASSYFSVLVPFAVEKRASPTITSITQSGAVNGGMNAGRTPTLSLIPTRAIGWIGTANVSTASGGFNDSFSASADL